MGVYIDDNKLVIITELKTYYLGLKMLTIIYSRKLTLPENTNF